MSAQDPLDFAHRDAIQDCMQLQFRVCPSSTDSCHGGKRSLGSGHTLLHWRLNSKTNLVPYGLPFKFASKPNFGNQCSDGPVQAHWGSIYKNMIGVTRPSS